MCVGMCVGMHEWTSLTLSHGIIIFGMALTYVLVLVLPIKSEEKKVVFIGCAQADILADTTLAENQQPTVVRVVC